ncbi:MAG: N-6 DNA methylase [Clostridia bacterium]|nr:N-6 DNA methylase [Clostridia bacterium]
MIKVKTINTNIAANILNVSEATVRNWMKSGLLNSELTIENVKFIKSSISNGEIERLNKRANKSKSSKSFVPSEYTNDESILNVVHEIVNQSQSQFKNISEAIFNIAIAFIDEVKIINQHCCFNRTALKQVFDNFNENSLYKPDISFLTKITNKVSLLKKSDTTDVLGLLYQSLLTEGDKSQKGSYYTPTKIIDELINDFNNTIESFLDPCCGTGAFILSAIKLKHIKPQNIYGADLDKNAVFLAKINVLNAYKDFNEVPKIFHIDTLNELATGDFFCETNYLIGSIDAIATNPPWGASKNSSPSAKYERLLGSKEIYSMFILKSIELLKEDGEMNFLLPVSILNIQTHKNIRNILCSKTKIVSIKEFGRAFTGVYTPVISIHSKLSKRIIPNEVRIQTLDNLYSIKQDRFIKTKDNVFDIKVNETRQDLIDKLYSIPHHTLKGHAKWALGIVTGNNKEHLKPIINSDLEPIFKGSDINYYYLKSPTNYIKYERELFQQIAKDEFYRANEKLVYKFISNKLVFAYDSKKSLTLNSANILIPNIPNNNIKTVLAFLNSSIFQFLHKIKFSTHKILKGDLEELPFPIIDSSTQNEIIKYVNRAIDGNENTFEIIDDIIFKIFRVTETEKIIIKNLVK